MKNYIAVDAGGSKTRIVVFNEREILEELFITGIGLPIETAEDLPVLFETQLNSCGVDYFDVYLLHAQTKSNYPKYKETGAYEFAYELKKQGKVKVLGLSFHDSAEFLDEILTEKPFVDVVQLQFNYADYEDEKNQSRLCYEVAKKHGKPVIVMEPLRGGALLEMQGKALELMSTLKDGSPASYAMRFAASFDNVFMVLSGMGNLAMVEENVSYMKNFVPLTEEEKELILWLMLLLLQKLGKTFILPLLLVSEIMQRLETTANFILTQQ